MKIKGITLVAATLLVSCSLWAATPKWVKNASKAMLKVSTFDENGNMIGNTNGFYITDNGVAVSAYAPFKGAAKATVIDAQGKELPVEYILGANSTYDVVKFRVASGKSNATLQYATATPNDSDEVTLMQYALKKQGEAVTGRVCKTEKVKEAFNYYTLAMGVPAGAENCPLFDSEGLLLGIVQQPMNESDTINYAIGISFADSLNITGLSINDATLNSIGIKKALPDTYDQAILSLYLGESLSDSVRFRTIIEDFITKFPQKPDGYTYRAQQYVNSGKYAEAQKDMEQAIKVSEKKDETHFDYAKLICNKETYHADDEYKPWSKEEALKEVDKAVEINPLPYYSSYKGDILYSMQRYDEAAETYKALTATNMGGAELYYKIARCYEQKEDTAAMAAMLDSAVNCFPRPFVRAAAPYLLARAQALYKCKKYRASVNDFNEYEKLMLMSLNDNFYYIRMQAELDGRLYQQAINDISKAIEMNPAEPAYKAELASIYIRVNMIDEAITAARVCVKQAPEMSDGYLFLGLAQCLKGSKEEGKKNLEKALAMGNQQAQTLIDKYAK